MKGNGRGERENTVQSVTYDTLSACSGKRGVGGDRRCVTRAESCLTRVSE